jgi:PD-(D/E)XK endonuclease
MEMHPPSKRAYVGSNPAGGTAVAHHTKDKGDLGVFKAQADLAAQGFMILLALTEHAPFDIAVYKDQRFRRVQVRYRACGRNGCLTVHLRSIWNDKRGTHRLPMNKEEVDVVCVYCPDNDRCYYFDPKKIQQSITLRLQPPRNGQRVGVRMAADYRRVP